MDFGCQANYPLQKSLANSWIGVEHDIAELKHTKVPGLYGDIHDLICHRVHVYVPGL